MLLIKCPKCGAIISDQAQMCQYCGTPVMNVNSVSEDVGTSKYDSQTTKSGDIPNIGLMILSFFIPFVGWVLWAVLKPVSTSKAKAYSMIAWVGFGLSVILYIATHTRFR